MTKAIIFDFFDTLAAPTSKGFQIYPDVMPILKTLHSKKIPLYVLSNYHSGILKVFEDLGIKEFFKEIFYSELTGFEKPDHRAFEYALKEIGFDKSEILFVGDGLINDIQPCRELGIPYLHISRDGHRHTERTIKSLSEVKNYLNGSPAS